MNADGKTHKTIRIATNSFTILECEYLCKVLYKNFDLSWTVQSSGINKGYIIYLKKDDINKFIDIVKPYMIKSMYYKLGIK